MEGCQRQASTLWAIAGSGKVARGPIMHQPPPFTTWKITCASPEEAQALRQWLSSRIGLDQFFTDTIHTYPDGVERVESVQHRLGDYFADVCVLPGFKGIPASFRLVFRLQPDAGRFWKDLMVDILKEVEAALPNASIYLESKGEKEPAVCGGPLH